MVFVDSNVWISYLNKEDKFHARALRALAKIRATTTIFVSSGIVYETINYLFKLRGKRIAEDCLNFFLTAPQIEIVLPSYETWVRAIETFRKNEMSLTDAQIVACMEEKQEHELYSFDRHFDSVQGIERLS